MDSDQTKLISNNSNYNLICLSKFDCPDGETPTRIIETKPEDGKIEVVEGTEDFTLNCEVRGNPTPEVIIGRADGKELDSSTSFLSGSILLFSKILKQHGGKYLCRARNKCGPPQEVMWDLKVMSQRKSIVLQIL